MKIAVLTQYFPTSKQPWAGHSAYQTLRILAEHCELKVFFPEAEYAALLRPKTSLGPLDRTWQPAGVSVDYIPYPVLPAISRPLNGMMMARKLRRAITTFQPDIILNYVVYPDGYAAVHIGRALGKPVVLTAIGSDLNRISDPLCSVLTRSALRQSRAVITVSNHLGETAIAMGSARKQTHPILNGCDTELFSPRNRAAARRALGLEEGAKTVVYIGRTDIRKGLLELVDALAILRNTHPQVRAYLVGDGPDKPLVEQSISRNSASGYVHLMPSCATAQVAEWMAAADVVTLPSYAEGCPNVVIEALCSGRPVVASQVGGIPELMDDSSGRLVPPKDVPALSEALAAVLDSRWDAQEIAAKHKRSWADVADDVLHVLVQTIRSESR